MQCTCGKDNPESATVCPQCGRPLGPKDRRRLWFDLAAALALVLAIAVVYLVDWLRPAALGPSIQEVSENVAVPRHSLGLAVTPPEYDDIGKLLDTLGTGYRHTTITLEDLLDPAKLSRYDIVFLTCGISGLKYQERVAAKLRENLRRFVSEGGTLYASDWRFEILDLAFHEFVDESRVIRGDRQVIQVRVVDPGLRHTLGSTIMLNFDKPAWWAAAFKGPELTSYLEGDFKDVHGRPATAPLLVKFPFGRGAVVFTSFHNETQNSDTETALLRYLVFAAVMAREGENVKRTMVHGGFSPQQRSLLSASSSNEAASGVYECHQAGPLQFVLAFDDRGARLRLTVTGPDGQPQVMTDTKTFRIDVPNAQVGAWRYTITPEQLPSPNFAFELVIGEKR
jgi:hypothetical protein